MRLTAPIVVVAAGAIAQPANSWLPELDRVAVTDARVRAAMQKVRRAEFLPEAQQKFEFEDRPLPIGYQQTTSQPTLIALMLQQLKLKPDCKVLEVGTGSGYQTALLAELCSEVASIDIVEPLAIQAKARLAALGYKNVSVKAGDGYLGWPEKAPFDAITVGAGAPKVPAPLIAQLKAFGWLVMPVEEQLEVLTKKADGGITTTRTLDVRFVPLTGPNADHDRRTKK